MDHFEQIRLGVGAFREELEALKSESNVDFPWYPYDTLANLDHLAPLISPEIDGLFSGGRRFADIGAADGALGFLFEKSGNQVDFYDFGPTNYNTLRGLRKLTQILHSKGNLFELDLDSQFEIKNNYDFGFFLGILYHIKNPYFVLESLSHHFQHIAISTRIVRHFMQGGPDLSRYTAAYLVGPKEMNNDPTNFWMFTEAGLRQLFVRTGWDIISLRTVGDTEASNPQDSDHDERAFAILKSRR